MLTPRCALKMPFGLLVEPDEKNSTAASLGWTAAPVASTRSRGSFVAAGQERVPPLNAGRRFPDRDEPTQVRVLHRLQRTGFRIGDLRLELRENAREVLVQHGTLE